MAETPEPGAAVQPRRTFPVSWEELHRHAKALAWRLMSLGPWTGIVAITRGGLVPAAIVARELEVRLIDTVCIASYDDRDQGGLEVLKKMPGDGTGWLIIDDLVDTGKAGRWSTRSSPRSARTPGSSSPGTPSPSRSRPSCRAATAEAALL